MVVGWINTVNVNQDSEKGIIQAVLLSSSFTYGSRLNQHCEYESG